MKAKKIFSNLPTWVKYVNFINANILVYIILFVKGVLVRKVLLPDEYGYFVQTQLLLSYGLYLQLGVLNALNFEIPGLIASGETEKQKRVVGSAFGFIIILALIFVVLAPVFMFMDLDQKMKYGFMFTMIGVALTLLVNTIENIYRGNQEFSKLSRILMAAAIIDIIGTLIFINLMGYCGLFVGLLLGLFISLLIIRKDLFRIKPIFSLKLTVQRINVGFPIFLNGMIWSLMLIIAQTIGFIFLSEYEMGEFSIATMAYSAIMIFPTVVSQIFYPKFLAIMSQTDNKSLVADYYNNIMNYYLKIIVCVCIGSLLILPYVIEIALPNYSNGTSSMRIMLLSLFVLSLNGIHVNIITGYRKATRVTMHLAVSFIVLVVAELLLIGKFQMNGIAIAVIIGYFTYFSMNIYYIYRHLKLEIKTQLKRSFISFTIYILPTFLLLYFDWIRLSIIFGTFAILTNIYLLVFSIKGKINEK